MDAVTALTVSELIERLKKYDGNKIVVILRDGNSCLYPITAEDWSEYKAGEVYFANTDVVNQNEPGLCISVI